MPRLLMHSAAGGAKGQGLRQAPPRALPGQGHMPHQVMHRPHVYRVVMACSVVVVS